MFKKLFYVLTVLMIPAVFFSSCSSQKTEDGKLDIVCTVFPAYDWTREIIGENENIRLTYLLESGADLHNFQPSADDMMKVSDCDIFVYVGGESDSWVDKALENSRNKDMRVIELMDILSDKVKEEEVIEGMDEEHEDHDHENEVEYDEHIWLSLKNAGICVKNICNEICVADPENSAVYTENSRRYISELQSLDNDFTELFSNRDISMIFGDRFPFRYFTDDYGINYYAAFTGCSADTEASFETITFLAEKADELDAGTIFAIENSDCTIAEAVIANTASGDQKEAVLDSAQSVTSTQIKEGTTYLSIMKKNYDVLKEEFSQ